MNTKTTTVHEAFQSWDNHREDCKSASKCTYDGKKCEKGAPLYERWRNAIGIAPVTAPRKTHVNSATGRKAGESSER